MRSRTSSKSLSPSHALIAIPVAGLITFVVGYTASRASLDQTSSQNTVAEVSNVVIPHEASLWSGFAK
ncbi:MAG: hypothetical protein RLZZ381_3814 [Cyanobacteriota bacterium]|jgi:hypothetical protein